MDKDNWHAGYYRLILFFSTLAFFGWFHLFPPGFRTAELPRDSGSHFIPAGVCEFLFQPDRKGSHREDPSANLIKIRYSIEKPESKADPNERFIREKIQVNADRAPKTALPPFPGEFLNYLPFVRSLFDQYSFTYISFLTWHNCRIRPPPVF
jgi:hypothetical protein